MFEIVNNSRMKAAAWPRKTSNGFFAFFLFAILHFHRLMINVSKGWHSVSTHFINTFNVWKTE
jgi:hypothetical protein